MAVCIYFRKKAWLFRHVHRKCREECALKLVALRDDGRFKDATMAAEEAINVDPVLSIVVDQLLSSIYFAVMCNDKESEVRDSPSNARTMFHEMEEQLLAANPSLYRFLYEGQSEGELEYKLRMRGCTAEALGCSYAYAREKAYRHTQAVVTTANPRSQVFESATEILETIRMMDQMYGLTGDDHDAVFSNTPQQYAHARQAALAQAPKHSDILEEMIQLGEANSILFSNAVTDRLTGTEATILMRKKTAGLLARGNKIFSISDTANEAEIGRWLNNPGMDSTKQLDATIVDMAVNSHVPTKMMERILQTLFQQDYEAYYQIADSRLRDKEHPLQ